MSMNLLLVRHGETTANIDKSVYLTTADHAVPLSDLGHQQAKDAGIKITKKVANLTHTSGYFEYDPGKTRIWSSPYLRTRQTSEHIQIALTKENIEFDYKEHINLCEQQYGLFDGIPDEELHIKYPNEYAHYKKCEDHEGKFWARMPLGESRFDVAIRVHQAFGTWHRDSQKHNIKNLIVVCHGVTLRAIVMQWLHLTPEWFEAEKNPDNCAIRLISDGCDYGYI